MIKTAYAPSEREREIYMKTPLLLAPYLASVCGSSCDGTGGGGVAAEE